MAEYELVTKLKYTNQADLNRMRDLASKGMNYPEMVDVSEDPNKFLRIREAQLIPILHKAIQELSTENEDLKNRVTQLENLVNQLILKVDPSIN